MRWQENVTLLEQSLENVIGDVLVSSGFIAYLGPFTVNKDCFSFLSNIMISKTNLD